MCFWNMDVCIILVIGNIQSCKPMTKCLVCQKVKKSQSIEIIDVRKIAGVKNMTNIMSVRSAMHLFNFEKSAHLKHPIRQP